MISLRYIVPYASCEIPILQRNVYMDFHYNSLNAGENKHFVMLYSFFWLKKKKHIFGLVKGKKEDIENGLYNCSYKPDLKVQNNYYMYICGQLYLYVCFMIA